ncbi:phosphatase PAP2 family protein [Desulfolucanica intricata]|uniref:phosphatase PAP2 family protein n=1 Tax=Desulfolucanica intricata TaxID=1285191 RepID=UPI0008346F60|nr:phosphatase PAP2 family protein [Desulfolucanica intricata]
MDKFFTKLLDLDNLIFNYVILIQRISFFDYLIPWIDYLAQKGVIWLLILLYFGAFKGRNGQRVFFWGILSMALAWGLSEIIKILVDRPRPSDILMVDLLLNKPSTPSFPSVQTSLAFAAVTVILANSNNTIFKSCILLLALIIGYSRIYAGISYPLDVIGGAILGKICAALVMGYIIKWSRNRRKYNVKHRSNP